MEQLTTLKNRLEKIGIDVVFVSNYPWVYLHRVNGELVNETYEANHGFTVGFLPIRRDRNFQFTELSVIFKTIRKYCGKSVIHE